MKHIVLTVLVCLDLVAFTAIYLRATEIVTHAIVEGLSEIPVSTDSSFREISPELSWIQACISSR